MKLSLLVGKKSLCKSARAIRADQHILGVTFAPGKNKKEPCLLSLYTDGELSSHPFYIDMIPEKNYIASGDKNDRITGQKNQKNTFEVSEGTKNFTGGDDDDLFLIYEKGP